MRRELVEVVPSLKEGDQVAGYVIEARIGVGGFGEVYRARHPVIGREVAIKVLHRRYSADPEAVARFVAEARAVNQISHPAIVEIFDFGNLEDGRQFCVMELITGTTLRDALRERTRLPLVDALPILRGIAEAVDAAHAAGIAHRDLKPDNVFVLEGGGTKLIDFGLAKLTREHDVPITQTGSVFGTPIYMSPEQCRGKATDTRTDLYSFGVLAYHVLTGEPPFDGDALELALHHLNDQPVPPSRRCKELSRKVDHVLLALLAKDPADRPHSLVNSIDALAGATTLRARRWKRRAQRAALIAIPLAIAAVVAAMWSRAPEQDDSECAPAAERLVGIWDPQLEAELAARFASVSRADIPATWRSVAGEMNDLAARWSKEWDRACQADERKTDPLLHQQRLNCLENALLEIHGATASMRATDVALFADGWIGGFNTGVLPEECARNEIVRVQPPAARPEQRAEVMTLMLEVHVLRVELRAGLNAGQSRYVEPALARFAEVANRLATLGAPVAAEVAALYAHYLMTVAQNDPKRHPVVRQAIATALQRADAVRDDTSLTLDYLLLVRLEMAAVDRDDAKIDDALARADAAYQRAGRPQIFNGLMPDTVRFELLVQRGQLEQAILLRPQDVVLLARLGRHQDAIAIVRGELDRLIAKFGEPHPRMVGAVRNLEHALARSGDFAAAASEADRVFELDRELKASVATLRSDRAWQLISDAQLGRADRLEALARAAFRGEASTNGQPLTAVEWGDVAGVGFGGSIELMRFVFEHFTDWTARANGVEWADARAYLDFMVGDMPSMAEHAMRVAPPTPGLTISGDAIPLAPWFLAIADAAAGRRSAAQARLSALATARFATSGGADNAAFASAWVDAALGRWSDARVLLEKLRLRPIWSRDWNLAEVDTWLGRSRLEAGDAAAAIRPLEEALGVLMECCDGFHYMAPMAELALARALWQTGGDGSRARALAEQARDGFARLGKGREPERQQAIAWLAEHPAGTQVRSACNALELPPTPGVTLVNVATAPPVPFGGVLVAGRYVLTAAINYTGSGGAAGPTPTTVAVLTVNDGTAIELVQEVVTGTMKLSRRASATYASFGTQVTITDHCPGTQAIVYGFDAGPTSFTLYSVTGGATQAVTFSKR